MEVGLFVLGLLLGFALGWLFEARHRREEATAEAAAQATHLRQLQAQLAEADTAIKESHSRLIALELEHKALQQRTLPLEADLAQSKRAAQQAMEMEARQREATRTLQAEVARLERELAQARAASPPAPRPAEPAPAAPAPEPAPPTAAASTAGAPAKKAAGAKGRGGRNRG